MKTKPIAISIILFLLLVILNTLRINNELSNFNKSQYQSFANELQVTIFNVKKLSLSLFENIINTPSVINIYKKANTLDKEQKNETRDELYNLLLPKYNKFTKYGIQQLHFHLPNNESFLRFHKPNKFGDDLTESRDSVRFVNKNKKSISGFEEGKIFNGYRFVYPLFDENKKHIGSVEISSSLLNFKKIFEKNNGLHLDYILTKETVLNKVFESQLKNYLKYLTFDDFLIQTTLKEYNHKDQRHKYLMQVLNHNDIKKNLLPIKEQFFSEFVDFKLYSVFFIPLLNDFTNKEVGYALILGESTYFKYFLESVVISYISLLLLSILIGYILYRNHLYIIKSKEKERFELESNTDELTKCLNRKAYNNKVLELLNLSKRYKDIKFSMILYDIDNFKFINDTYGHDVGDRVLIELSDLIKSVLRKTDYLFRIGGEEFIIILYHINLKNSVKVAQKIKNLIEKKLKTIENEDITISLGVTEVKKDDTKDSIFKRVDELLYQSKRTGKNKISSNINDI